MKHLLGILFLLIASLAYAQNTDVVSLPSVQNKV